MVSQPSRFPSLMRNTRTAYEDKSCVAYGDEEDHAFCFLGVSTDTIEPWTGGPLILDDSPEAKFPFSASCNVAYENGKVTFLECVLPENI